MVVAAYIISFITILIFCMIYYYIFVMGTVSFYELAYLLSHKMGAGGSVTVVLDTIIPCLWVFITLSIIVFLLYKYLFKSRKQKIVFASIFLIFSLLCLIRTVHFDEYVINSFKKTDIYEKYYVNPNNVEITLPDKKRNLIIIYLESMETSLFSSENGGAFDKSIIPELEDVAINNFSFSNTDKMGGSYTLTKTAFTASSITASTTGTPINIKLFNGYNDKKPFMESVRSLGNVLSDNGYNLELMQGSGREFSAIDLYAKYNGNYKIFDDKVAKEKGLVDDDYFVWWGIEDKKLLEFSKEEILTLAKDDEPFFFMLFTMDTHFKDGYLDKSCDSPHKEHLANSYSCSSKMINEYLNWLKKQDFYNDTTIILLGDHQVMQDSFYKEHKDFVRVNYNVFINSQTTTENNKKREFSMFDMYPTILASLGAKIEGNKLGFGVNLFSDEKTIIEKIGRSTFDKELLKSSDYYDNYIFIDKK